MGIDAAWFRNDADLGVGVGNFANEIVITSYSIHYTKLYEIAGHERIAKEEPILFFNFRSDRARQLSAALGLEDFDGFDRENISTRNLVCMTEYDATFPFPVLFKAQIPDQVLAQVISDAGLRQLHCAETEKYPHVTYFFIV